MGAERCVQHFSTISWQKSDHVVQFNHQTLLIFVCMFSTTSSARMTLSSLVSLCQCAQELYGCALHQYQLITDLSAMDSKVGSSTNPNSKFLYLCERTLSSGDLHSAAILIVWCSGDCMSTSCNQLFSASPATPDIVLWGD